MNTKKVGTYSLAIGALGVVFGDIGTSPLYAVRAIFSHREIDAALSAATIHGIVSLLIWSVVLVVSVKYVHFITRADNDGEGGILALAALLNGIGISRRVKLGLVALGIIGLSLFYGDSVITPAISVLSAVEGIRVVAPDLHGLILPLTLGILAGLFVLQQRGSGAIGRLFGPVMLVWFVTLGAGGLLQIVKYPEILGILSPLVALRFVADQPGLSFIAMGSIILAITGAEALYADMGHFGRGPIARLWFWLVFPALALNYMGQAALVTHQPAAIANPFYLLFPASARLPVIVLATVATLIASQAVISGAFSLTRQAIQLKYLPRLTIKHTSRREYGQIYLPFVNWTLCALVTLLVVGFGSSARLATAYGIAVSGTLLIDSILFLAVIRYRWRTPWPAVVSWAAVFLSLDLLFVAANVSKIWHGGWFPILLALLVATLIVTWLRGQKIITTERLAMEGMLADFVQRLRGAKNLTRLPGSAVYLSLHPRYTPLALRATVDRLHELHEHVVIVNVETRSVPHVPELQRISFDPLGYQDDGISHISLFFGFKDTPDLPQALLDVRGAGVEVNFDLASVTYFVSTLSVIPTHRPNLPRWQKALYRLLSRHAVSPAAYYKLPPERTVELDSTIKL